MQIRYRETVRPRAGRGGRTGRRQIEARERERERGGEREARRVIAGKKTSAFHRGEKKGEFWREILPYPVKNRYLNEARMLHRSVYRERTAVGKVGVE